MQTVISLIYSDDIVITNDIVIYLDFGIQIETNEVKTIIPFAQIKKIEVIE
jgi:hypothetical protein